MHQHLFIIDIEWLFYRNAPLLRFATIWFIILKGGNYTRYSQ
jgi:hypothetical protein